MRYQTLWCLRRDFISDVVLKIFLVQCEFLPDSLIPKVDNRALAQLYTIKDDHLKSVELAFVYARGVEWPVALFQYLSHKQPPQQSPPDRNLLNTLRDVRR